ncbi:cupin domain [Brevibacterium sanguinis]|uniref:Cupin domain n=2 Tax=Brevibacterium TaxID=1696 RepID=A0A366ILB2_9MICO|nr:MULTISPECIES: helix-turn-helix domain-containing protein [Brevibacterium]RBP64160.1 cupin domain [Brevibacterium sanguinis]RBP71548.1 cupin domain [Brevibacterium celere]
MRTRPARHRLLPPDTADPHRAVRFDGHAVHSHDHPQLIHVVSGSVVVDVGTEAVALGRGCSLWLATGVPHAVRSQRDSIILGPQLSSGTEPPDRWLLLERNETLGELALLILARSPMSAAEIPRFRAALDEHLRDLAADDLFVPEVRHPRIRTLATDPLILRSPLTSLAAARGLSTRHLERLIRAETGMTFVAWRTRRRINQALRLIRAGAGRSAAARAVGYQSSDGLLKAIERLTGLSREDLREDLSGAVRDWCRQRRSAPASVLTE